MAPRLLAAGLVLAASACGPLTAPGFTADAAPARGPSVAGGAPVLYRLSITPAEKAALRTALDTCPAEAGRR
ncbi:hypothetical protein GCM10010269_21140 [Streptomyces humidus]|uniref:Uncharacterized protein n=1 Tax=Streptomyces humidus TaxID=52259 RepID=A0A918L2M9_9ACTN|nr:hypothetical protein [Streptomyces humidus]GGR81705.1 hypothetical protein GCM10010269_21140 [Streptomyces humidus]